MADYLYGSANVRALENAIIGRERVARLLETKTVQECYALLGEWGVRIERDAQSGAIKREDTLLGILRDAYVRVTELVPDSASLALWRYPYDCNNLKAAIKCFARRIDPRPMLFDFGSVDAETVVQMVENGTYDALPTHMRVAAGETVAEFAKIKNPQVVDLMLDRACYADMLEGAKKSKNEFVLRLVLTKLDLTNVMILLRILRMKSGEAGKALLAEALLEGGKLSKDVLVEWFDRGETYLLSQLRTTAYGAYADAFLQSGGTLTDAERLADNALMEIVRETKFIPIGEEVMVSFLLAHEYEVRNLRILLSGKEAGVSTAIIRERIRESYV
ncbi:MAG: V-type ATPase subunit [Clostridia bacterium]|nr:V-type ATPase subunit [Clostridia bacterium]